MKFMVLFTLGMENGLERHYILKKRHIQLIVYDRLQTGHKILTINFSTVFVCHFNSFVRKI